MKKLTYSIVAAFVAMTILAPTAMAQEETTIIEETTVYPEGAPAAGDTGGGAAGDTGEPTSGGAGDTMGGGGSTAGTTGGMTSGMGGASGGANTEATTAGDPLPTSGGPAILAPAVALLLGSGVVAFAVLRRRG